MRKKFEKKGLTLGDLYSLASDYHWNFTRNKTKKAKDDNLHKFLQVRNAIVQICTSRYLPGKPSKFTKSLIEKHNIYAEEIQK